jgi:hypothetical protein
MRGASPVERFYQAFRQLPGPESLCLTYNVIVSRCFMMFPGSCTGTRSLAERCTWRSHPCGCVRSSWQITLTLHLVAVWGADQIIKSFVTIHRFFDRGKFFWIRNTEIPRIKKSYEIFGLEVWPQENRAHRAGRWVGLVQFLPGLVSLRVQVTAVEWACIPVIPVDADWSVLLMADKLASCGHETTDLQYFTDFICQVVTVWTICCAFIRKSSLI